MVKTEYFTKLKPPNNRNQLLKVPVLKKALQNWLLSMKLSYENNDVQFICDNTKAQAIDKKSKKRIGINKSNLNILEKQLLNYKKYIGRKELSIMMMFCFFICIN